MLETLFPSFFFFLPLLPLQYKFSYRFSTESHSQSDSNFSPARYSGKSYHQPLHSLFLPYSKKTQTLPAHLPAFQNTCCLPSLGIPVLVLVIHTCISTSAYTCVCIYIWLYMNACIFIYRIFIYVYVPIEHIHICVYSLCRTDTPLTFRWLWQGARHYTLHCHF